MTIGSRIKTAREAMNFSIGTLADHTGIHATMLYRYENDRGLPGVETIKRIARALDVSIDELVRDV